MQLPDSITTLIPGWLTRQRWFSKSGSGPSSVEVLQSEELSSAWPKLLWTILEVDGSDTYQVPIGMRRKKDVAGILLGHNDALIGSAKVDGDEVLFYDALIDGELNKRLLETVSEGKESASSARPIHGEQSNSSLVYDNRLIMKMFRRLHKGANPDVDVVRQLTAHGFGHVAPVIATWERSEFSLAVVQPYLADATDGSKLAMASVRDFLGSENTGGSATTGSPSIRIEASDPGHAGGDFADEAHRLGEMTAELHVALAQQFPTENFDCSRLISSLSESSKELPEQYGGPINELIEDLRKLPPGAAGLATRVHGDYHLAQTLRAVSGWYVLDFEGEVTRPLSERTLPSSPLKDVSAMVRSFQYHAMMGLLEQIPVDRDVMVDQANAWERRNRDSFRRGYLSVEAVERLLPAHPEHSALLFTAFEAEKAIYELAYERAYRPDWIHIPQSALDRLLSVQAPTP